MWTKAADEHFVTVIIVEVSLNVFLMLRGYISLFTHKIVHHCPKRIVFSRHRVGVSKPGDQKLASAESRQVQEFDAGTRIRARLFKIAALWPRDVRIDGSQQCKALT